MYLLKTKILILFAILRFKEVIFYYALVKSDFFYVLTLLLRSKESIGG